MVIAPALQKAAQSPQPVHFEAVNESRFPESDCRVSLSAPVGHMPVQRGQSVQDDVMAREGKHRLRSVSEIAGVREAMVVFNNAFFFGSRRIAG